MESWEFAQILKRVAHSAIFLGFPITLISGALGHQSVATTEVYLKSFVDEVLDEGNELVIT